MKNSVLVACIISFVILAYFGVSTILRGSSDDAEASKGAQTVLQTEASQSDKLPRIVTTVVQAELHPVYLSLKGRTTPNRTVTVRSATTGTVTQAPNVEGKEVGQGALLCRLDVDERQARVAEANALLLAQQQEFDASTQLFNKGLAPSNRLNMAKANLDAARASTNAATIELKRTEIRAPFAGVFETRMAERGDFLSPGSACGVIADLNPIRVEAEITEEYATALQQGAPVAISILDGTPRNGQISYVARTSNEATRTFKVEATLANDDGAISAGLTSDIRIKLGEDLAILISPGLLTLHDDGRLGVRYVTDQNMVVFAPVTIIDDTQEGVWITGLPERVNVVSIGQEYIREGARVVTIAQAEVAP